MGNPYILFLISTQALAISHRIAPYLISSYSPTSIQTSQDNSRQTLKTFASCDSKTSQIQKIDLKEIQKIRPLNLSHSYIGKISTLLLPSCSINSSKIESFANYSQDIKP